MNLSRRKFMSWLGLAAAVPVVAKALPAAAEPALAPAETPGGFAFEWEHEPPIEPLPETLEVRVLRRVPADSVPMTLEIEPPPYRPSEFSYDTKPEGGLVAIDFMGDDGFVAVGSNGEIQTSPDGVSWTKK